MIKIYKYSFYPLILACLFFINLLNITKSQLKNEIILEKEKNEKRIVNLFHSNLIMNRKLEDVICYNILDGRESRTINKDSTYLVTLLSDFDCAKCQETELLKLQSIKSMLEERGIKIICLTVKEKINHIAAQMKYIKLRIPLYYIDNNVFYNTLSFHNKYPQVLFVYKGSLISAFNPITKDFEFSEMFYNDLLSKL